MEETTVLVLVLILEEYNSKEGHTSKLIMETSYIKLMLNNFQISNHDPRKSKINMILTH